jgi:sugar lactone lactonase YvrE
MTTNGKLLLSIAACGMLPLSLVFAQDTTSEPTQQVMMGGVANPAVVTVAREGLFPEGVEYDSINGRFLVSSIAEGTVNSVADDGTLTPLIEDDRIPSSTGLEVDEAGNRLLVAATDLESEAFLGIYDLATGANLAFVDFAPLLPTDPEHFANDVAVDSAGNAYVTDSMAGVIYRADPQGTPSIFLEDETFSTQSALNGIVYHPQGDYLLAVRVPGLIKIPLSNPAAFTPVEIGMEIPGEDGLVLIDERTLVVVSNVQGRVYRIESDDDFTTGRVTGVFETGPVFPSTVAVRGSDVYVLHAHLNAEETPVTEFPIQRVDFAPMSADTMATPEATPAS